MSDSIITVQNLSKRYRLGAGRSNERYTALRDVIADKARSLFRRNGRLAEVRSPASDEFWALKDISFEVKQGEVLGIIGRNGAGKSTLLKILSRITEPTEGRIKIKGRVASLLEVGTGFHPELTGRENIFLNGAILGMHRWEIKAKFDEIVAFAEVEKFLDTPVKRFSSGMYVRLAFAVAAHLEPEILIVDEVLAVGDAEFQKKCLGKMSEVARGGRTVLFVSHQMAAVERLCGRGIVLNQGRVTFDGITAEAISVYLAAFQSDAVVKDWSRARRTGNGAVRFVGFDIQNASGQSVSRVTSGSDVSFAFAYERRRGELTKRVNVGLSVHDHRGDILSVFYSSYIGFEFSSPPTNGWFVCKVCELPLSPGRYYIGGRMIADGNEADWPREMIGSMDVDAGDFYGHGCFDQHPIGPLLVRGSWDLKCDSSPRSSL